MYAEMMTKGQQKKLEVKKQDEIAALVAQCEEMIPEDIELGLTLTVETLEECILLLES